MTSQHNENKNGVDQAEHERLVRRWENLRETYRSVKEAEAEQRLKAGELAEELSAASREGDVDVGSWLDYLMSPRIKLTSRLSLRETMDFSGLSIEDDKDDGENECAEA